MTRGVRSTQGRGGTMHPLFRELYLSGDLDDQDETEAERRSARSRARTRSRPRLLENKPTRRLGLSRGVLTHPRTAGRALEVADH